jgi:hypothetical protein
MSIELNRRAVDHARGLIEDGCFVSDERLDWRDHHRRAADEDAFIREHGIDAYANWHLGIDDEEPEGSKARFHYPYGDFSKVHRCALYVAEDEAEELVLGDIELAAEDLLRRTGTQGEEVT